MSEIHQTEVGLILKNKGTVFIEHIEKHLEKKYGKGHRAEVVCKFCWKSVDQIYEEYKSAHATSIGQNQHHKK